MGEVEAHLDSLLEAAVINFRFTFEMKPTQVSIAVLKSAIHLVENESKSTILTEELRASI